MGRKKRSSNTFLNLLTIAVFIIIGVLAWMYTQGKFSEPEGTTTIPDTSSETIDSARIAQANTTRFEVKNPLPTWPDKPPAERGKLYPFDQAGRDSSFVDFRQQLYEAVVLKDVQHVLAATSDSVHFSFGIGGGKTAFTKHWLLDTSPNSSEIWQALAAVLNFGGGFTQYEQGQSFVAPYQSATDELDDPFSAGVIIGTEVRLRDQPSTSGEVLASLSWDRVEVLFEDNVVEQTLNGETHSWKKVKTAKGTTGYIWGKYLGYNAGYRAFFSKKNGQWKMDVFISGD